MKPCFTFVPLAAIALVSSVMEPVVAEQRRAPVVYQLGMTPNGAEPTATAGEPDGGWIDWGLRGIGQKDTGNVDDFLNGIKNFDDFQKSPGGWFIGKAGEGASIAIATGKTYTAYQDDKRRHAQLSGFTGAREYSKCLAGILAGGKVAAILVAGTAEAPLVITIVVIGGSAWAVTTATEVTVEFIANKFFHPQKDVVNTSRIGKVDPDLVDWLGTRAGEYRVINIRMPDVEAVRGVVLPEHLTPAEIKKILEAAQANCMDRAKELLSGIPNPFGPPSKETSLATLGDMTPVEIRTEKQLQEYVRKLAHDAVTRRGLGPQTGEETQEAQIEAFFRRGYPYIRNAWKQRRNRWAADLRNAVRNFGSRVPTLTYRLIPAALDPKQNGKTVVSVTATDNTLNNYLSSITRLAERIEGQPPAFRFQNSWTWDDGPSNPVSTNSGPQVSHKQTVEFTGEGEKLVVFSQVLTVLLPRGGNVLQERRFAEVEIKVANEYPEDLTGLWTGALKLTSIPFLSQLAAAPKPAQPANTKDEGCDVSLFAGLSPEEVQKLVEKIKAATFPLKANIKPKDAASGTLVLTITRPADLPGDQKDREKVLPSLSYRYEAGVLTVTGPLDKATMSMRATFSRVDNNAWKLNGTFTVTAEENGKTLKAADGTWTGTQSEPPSKQPQGQPKPKANPPPRVPS